MSYIHKAIQVRKLLDIYASLHSTIKNLFQVYELDTANFDLVAVDRVRINSLGDVEIRVPATPDLRFTGRIVILE